MYELLNIWLDNIWNLAVTAGRHAGGALVLDFFSSTATWIITNITCLQTGQMRRLGRGGGGGGGEFHWAINQTFLIYDSVWLFFSPIKCRWVAEEISSLRRHGSSEVGLGAISFHQSVLISSSDECWLKWMVKAQAGKTQPTLPALQEEAGSWIQLGSTHQDAARMLFGCYLATQLLPSSEP